MRRYEIGELMTDEDSLAHYGIKGMKWGVRRGKGVTGVSRARGARIDKNDRHLQLFKDVRDGLGNKGGGKAVGRVQKNVINGLNRMTMGKNLTKKYYDFNIKKLEAQNERLKSGTVTVRDRLQVALATTPASLVVSYRPKD